MEMINMATASLSFSQVETHLQTFPVGQEVQEVELGEEEKEPAAHMSQSELPRCDWASPAGHP